MTRKPANVERFGFNAEQRKLLGTFDHLGNLGWDRNGQTDAIMSALLNKAAEKGLTVDAIIGATQSVDYDTRMTHQLERRERKRLTGKFGK